MVQNRNLFGGKLTRICSDCQKICPSEATYCIHCGKHLSDKCRKCGETLPSGAVFCIECGSRVKIGQQEEFEKENSDHKNKKNDSNTNSPETTNEEKYYVSILDLRGRQTPDDIKKKYRDLARQYHPDKVSHLGPKLRETAETEMKLINTAFEYFKKKYGI